MNITATIYKMVHHTLASFFKVLLLSRLEAYILKERPFQKRLFVSKRHLIFYRV